MKILAAALCLPAVAWGDPLEEVVTECQAQLGMSEYECTCIRDLAAENLSEKQVLFLLAKVRGDQQGERDLAMQGTEAVDTVAFMNTAPVACRNN